MAFRASEIKERRLGVGGSERKNDAFSGMVEREEAQLRVWPIPLLWPAPPGCLRQSGTHTRACVVQAFPWPTTVGQRHNITLQHNTHLRSHRL